MIFAKTHFSKIYKHIVFCKIAFAVAVYFFIKEAKTCGPSQRLRCNGAHDDGGDCYWLRVGMMMGNWEVAAAMHIDGRMNLEMTMTMSI